MPSAPKWLLVAFALSSTLGFIGLAVLGWGDWESLIAHPARLGVCIAAFLLVLVSAFSDINLSSGKRADTGDLWIVLPTLVLTVLLGWLPAFTDRRGILTVDGDVVRYSGLVLYLVGGALRVWPIFVLGRRFSGLVAIQQDHELVTDGLYTLIRHPSYLGGFVALAGWALAFRSAVGVLLIVPFIWIGIVRMNAEEAFLESEFGERYAAYRRRTWRLIPLIY